MSVSNISNNNSAQLQVYAQETKAAAATTKSEARSADTLKPAAGESVQISDRARALFEKEAAAATQGNGGGIIPPGNAPVTGGNKDNAATTLGNGGGIIPPGN